MSGVDGDKVVQGLRAQLERSSRFTDTIDIGAAVTTYRGVVELLTPQLPQLRVAAGLPPRPAAFARWNARLRTPRRYAALPVPSDRVFTYWNRPVETAPPLVQACLAQLTAVYPAARVLDGAGVRELVTVPDRVATLLEGPRPAHFSDYVRTRILAEHGGIWVDATSWVDRDLGAVLAKDLRGGTVFPRWTKHQIGNWFIASHPGTPLITLQRLALDAWWDAHDDLPDYFLYHRIFEVLQALVPEVHGAWDATPTLSAAWAHRLQLAMMQPYEPMAVSRMLGDAPLQKLSYKYDDVPAGSTLAKLLDNGFADCPRRA